MTYIEQEKIDKTYLAVESYKMPFKITNMLALVSKKNLIIFDNNSKISKKLLYKFNKGSYRELNYKTEDFSTINKNKLIEDINKGNFNSVMFVSDSNVQLPTGLLNALKPRTYKLEINITSNPQIEKIKYSFKNKVYNYTILDYNKKLSLVTMAVFSDPDTFNCSYEKILNSVVPIYSYYLNKSNYLKNISKEKKLCSASINNNLEYLYYQSESERLNDLINEVNTNKFNNIDSIFTKVNGVENKEIDIEKDSCIYVY